tara:strand:+ start:278 stop:679 length:402 start_codon:yes stop_codon:yes gene_type:complete
MIRVVRTRNGDDVICDIQEITQEGEKKILGYQLEHPYYAHLDEELTVDYDSGNDEVGVNKITNPTLVLHPYAPLSKDTKIIVRFDEIVSAYEPNDLVLEKYNLLRIAREKQNAETSATTEQNGLPDGEGDGAG